MGEHKPIIYKEIFDRCSRITAYHFVYIKPEKLEADPASFYKGYQIVIRHPSSITEPLTKFSERIAGIMPADNFYQFNEKNLHTTITCNIEAKTIEQEFKPDMDIIAKLNDIVNSVHKKLDFSGFKLDYGKWGLGYNKNAVIASAPPTQEFVTISNSILSELFKNGFEWRDPWGPHITTARFLGDREGNSHSKDLEKLMKEAPELGESAPTAIEVTTYSPTGSEWVVETYGRFELKK